MTMRDSAFAFAASVDRAIEQLAASDYHRRNGRAKTLLEELLPLSRLGLHFAFPGLVIEVVGYEDDGTVDGTILSSGPELLRFFVHYASWNGYFANGVSALTSLLGNRREIFREAGFARAVADRSNYIASFFFDAARDEYDDHINPLRDSHRCMAQASLLSPSLSTFGPFPDPVGR